MSVEHNSCCEYATCPEYAIMATYFCNAKSLLSAAKVSEAMYGNQPIFMQSF